MRTALDTLAGATAEAQIDTFHARRGRRPWFLTSVGVLIAALLLLPLAFLVIEAATVGWSEIARLLFRRLTATLLWNTVELTALVTLACALLGFAAAFLVERTDLPGRRFWAVLVVLPVGIPDFVVGYSWASWVPVAHGLAGAAIVMTLSLYPLVYLPVAAGLRGADQAHEEMARSLGLGRWHTLLRVTLRQARTALLGGCLIVALALLAEYGAFEILRFQTFTTEIFTEFRVGFNSPAASALSLVLVVLGLSILAGESAAGRGGRVARAQVSRTPRRHHLDVRSRLPALAALACLAALALGLPLGTLAYWLLAGGSTTVPAASMAGALWQTLLYSASAAGFATLLALPVALLAVRYRCRTSILIERSTFVVQGLPGLVIALSLVFFAIRYAFSLYQSPQLLVLAYVILFFPLALVAVRASVAAAPVGLEEIGRSLGKRPLVVTLRVTVPLVAPGLAAAFCLVFLSAATELTATLILIPTGVHTLATRFWAYETNLSYGAAAPYAAMIVLTAALPSFVLGHLFERTFARGERSG